MPILQDLLNPSFVRGVITRVLGPGRFLSESFGFGIGGPNVQQVPGRVYTYDIFDNVASVSNFRSGYAPAGTIAVNPVGNNVVALGRAAEKIGLDYNQLLRIRAIGEGASTEDMMGVRYAERQLRVLRQRADNTREFITASMFNGGKYGYYISGDDWIPTLDVTNANVVVDMKIDTGNVLTGGSFAAGLQMGTGSNILTASWATTTTDIPANLDAISSAFEDLVGAPLKRIYCGSDVWNNVLNNDKVRQVAGSVNKPAEFQRIEKKNDYNGITTYIVNTLTARPWLEWYVCDESLQLNSGVAGATVGRVKCLPRSYCTFMVDPGAADWMKMIEGSMAIMDNDLAEPVERYGFYTWAMRKADPAMVWYHTNQLLGIELNIPKAIAWARVQ